MLILDARDVPLELLVHHPLWSVFTDLASLVVIALAVAVDLLVLMIMTYIL